MQGFNLWRLRSHYRCSNDKSAATNLLKNLWTLFHFVRWRFAVVARETVDIFVSSCAVVLGAGRVKFLQPVHLQSSLHFTPS
jgi:hypothetical protein